MGKYSYTYSTTSCVCVASVSVYLNENVTVYRNTWDATLERLIGGGRVKKHIMGCEQGCVENSNETSHQNSSHILTASFTYPTLKAALTEQIHRESSQ